MHLQSLLATTLAAVVAFTATAQTKPLYLNDNAPIQKRVEDALSRMTLAEKVAMCHAQSKFSSPGVPRLGIPEVWCTDGPHGIREEVLWDQWSGAGWTNDRCTAFPALTCMAATWNPQMANLYGVSIGEEARYRNKNILLGPGLNIYRTPLGGRNFEYMGEDPYLTGQMAVEYIKGVQSNGVAVCVKHFALNNQEVNRHTTDVVVSDRALYEIYLPAFKAAVQKGGAWSVMGAYNLYQGQHCCHNKRLLNDILKDEWGFKGVLVSDWGGTHDMRQAVENGLDLEFGTWTDGQTMGQTNAYDRYYLAANLQKAIESGEYPQNVLDDKCRRILTLIFRTTMNRDRTFGRFVSPEHSAAARTIADEGIVLLKNNEKLLPIDGNVKSILVVGENATRSMVIGGGSSSLKVAYEVKPLEGLQNRYGLSKVTYMKGYTSGKDTVETLASLRNAAAISDYVIFVGGLNKNPHQDSEGSDRTSLELPYAQDAVIETLLAANPKTIVVIISGDGVAMPWINDANAVVQAWHSGSEAGNALADILSGDVNPSGKLPYTYYASLDQCAAHTLGEYPGKNGIEHYNDDIWVGYRYIDRQGLHPTFPFGHGLSYTTFEYKNIRIDKTKAPTNATLTVSADITNTGSRTGKEIVQFYITDKKCSVERPVKELKGFEKVTLEPNETKTVSFKVDSESLAFFDVEAHAWKVEPGTFTASLGASSADIRGSVDFEIK